MREYLKSDPLYASQWSNVWLWSEFPSRHDFSGKDTGIDRVVRTVHGDYWAVQCKCLKEDTRIDKPMVDTFLSTSGKFFYYDPKPRQQTAIEWVVECYAATVHKESGITNNPNDWAAEHGSPRYMLDLLLLVITVSIKTVEVVERLPKVEWK
jgi:predicted helicase